MILLPMARSFRPTLTLLAGFSLLPLIPTAQAQFAGGLVENRGQWPDEVLYMARLPGQTVWVTREAIVYDFFEVERGADRAPLTPALSPRGGERGIETPDPHGPMRRPDEMREATERRVRGHVVELRFDGGAVGTVRPGRTLTTRLNYFLGDDPARHAVNVPVVEEVMLEGLYGGVALRLRSVVGVLTLTFEAADPAQLSSVRLAASGSEALYDEEGTVIVETSLGRRAVGLILGHAGADWYAGTVGAGGVQVDLGRATSAGRAVSPAPARSADEGLAYSTFLGGASFDVAWAVAVGADGSATVAGYTRSLDFPTTSGAYDETFNGEEDTFVARLSADGTSLLYATFLGGTDTDYALSVAAGADGSTTVAGGTSSSDFPTTPGAYDETFNSEEDAFVARLSADGASLVYSTFLGGTDTDYARAATVGADGSATVAGLAESSDFPTTPGAYDETYNFEWDVFVARLSADGTSLVYSTFLGGTLIDRASAVAVGTDGSATVAGTTYSTDLPTTSGAYDEIFNGLYDAFVARLSADGASLLYSTFLGGTTGGDMAYTVAVSADGSATVAGETFSTDFPTTSGAYDETYNGGGSDAFVLRLSADGTSLLYSTFLGGTNSDAASAVGVGADGSATVAGSILSSNFPTTPGAYDETHNGDLDAFVARLSTDGANLLYSTFLGGMGIDGTNAVGVGADGSATVAGSTRSSDFPTTPGAYDETHNGESDAFVAALQLPIPVPIAMPPGGPGTSALHGAAPNPFQRQARLRLDIAEAQGVTVRVYDVTGREVARLLDAFLAPGVYEVVLDGSRLPTGVYLVRATGERFMQTQYVTRIR